MNLTIIAAMSENRVIGKDNDLVWHLPKDLKHFKELTKGHHIIMGRKTFESMNTPLPHRTNIVVTSDRNYKVSGAIVVHSLQEGIEKAEHDHQPFIIGGGEIYRQGLEFANTIELTLVHGRFEGDTFFPEFDEQKWELVKKESHVPDEKHEYGFDFLRYQRQTQ